VRLDRSIVVVVYHVYVLLGERPLGGHLQGEEILLGLGITSQHTYYLEACATYCYESGSLFLRALTSVSKDCPQFSGPKPLLFLNRADRLASEVIPSHNNRHRQPHLHQHPISPYPGFVNHTIIIEAQTMPTLIVYLDKCTDLTNRDFGSLSDPYVKFHLEQDNWVLDKNFGKTKSATKKDDLNPIWGETYAFDIPSLKNMVLHCMIKDEDIGLDDKLGQCSINLAELGLSEKPIDVERVIDGNTFHKNAKIYLKLSYRE
jgi:hypothetical protein